MIEENKIRWSAVQTYLARELEESETRGRHTNLTTGACTHKESKVILYGREPGRELTLETVPEVARAPVATPR